MLAFSTSVPFLSMPPVNGHIVVVVTGATPVQSCAACELSFAAFNLFITIIIHSTPQIPNAHAIGIQAATHKFPFTTVTTLSHIALREACNAQQIGKDENERKHSEVRGGKIYCHSVLKSRPFGQWCRSTAILNKCTYRTMPWTLYKEHGLHCGFILYGSCEYKYIYIYLHTTWHTHRSLEKKRKTSSKPKGPTSNQQQPI